MHHRNVETPEAGTAAGEREDGLDVHVLLRAAVVLVHLIAKLERLEVRPRLCHRAEIGGRVRHNGAAKRQREVSQRAMREQGRDERGEGRVGAPLSHVASAALNLLLAVPLERREGGEFRDERVEVLWQLLGQAGLVRLGDGEGVETGEFDVGEEMADDLKPVARYFETAQRGEGHRGGGKVKGCPGMQANGEIFEVREGGDVTEMVEIDGCAELDGSAAIELEVAQTVVWAGKGLYIEEWCQILCFQR